MYVGAKFGTSTQWRYLNCVFIQVVRLRDTGSLHLVDRGCCLVSKPKGRVKNGTLTTCRPINPLLTVKDIVHCINLVQPSHIAVSAAYYDKVQEALQNYEGSIPTLFSVLDQISGIQKVQKHPSASRGIGMNVEAKIRIVSGGYRR